MEHFKRDYRSKASVYPLLPSGGLRGCGTGQNSTFSEYGHVAYQIKGNDACINMVENGHVSIIYTCTHPEGGGGGSGVRIPHPLKNHKIIF